MSRTIDEIVDEASNLLTENDPEMAEIIANNRELSPEDLEIGLTQARAELEDAFTALVGASFVEQLDVAAEFETFLERIRVELDCE